MNTAYLQPREKLRQKGVVSLSDTELLQVIISSGVSGIPVARIARKLSSILSRKGERVTLTDLSSIPGVGHIKAGQLLAAFEYTRRHITQQTTSQARLGEITTAIDTSLVASKQDVLCYVLLDGALRAIDEDTLPLSETVSRAMLIQNIFSRAVHSRAVSIYVAIGSTHKQLEPSLTDLAFAKDLFTTAKVLSIRVHTVVIVSSLGKYRIKGGEYVG